MYTHSQSNVECILKQLAMNFNALKLPHSLFNLLASVGFLSSLLHDSETEHDSQKLAI